MYKLVLLHDDAVLADEVRKAVFDVVDSTWLRTDAIEFCTLDEAIADVASQAVVLYLASPSILADDVMNDKLGAALDAGIAILPVARSEVGLTAILPRSIGKFNALIWTSAAESGLKIARLLGMVERERKIFLSYRRTESEALALQLRRALSERSYDVFLDRFSISPGADFQARLTEELADKAFVLLLESADAVNSDWVQQEVSYALSHQISVIALSLPDAKPRGLFGVIDNAFRVQIDRADLVGSTKATRELSGQALERILDVVELHAARQLRRRREILLGSVREFLFNVGATRTSVDSWAVLAQMAGQPPTVHLVTPRAPTAVDLFRVDELRKSTALEGCRGVVVHAVADRNEEGIKLTQWIPDSRPLRVATVGELAEMLGL